MTEILVGICQALVHKTVQEYKYGILNEDLNLEFLNDGLWKATRFGLNCKIYDTGDCKIITLKEMIETMFNYIEESLYHFRNSHIYKFMDRLDNFQTEADKQIKIYNNSGFSGLNNYLIKNVDYNKKTIIGVN